MSSAAGRPGSPPQRPDASNASFKGSRRRSIGERIASRRPIVGDSRHYTRFVGLMKWLLPLGAVALVALVVISPYLTGREDGVSFSFAALETTVDEALFMTNARLFGSAKSESGKQPFTVTAESVRQESGEPDIVHFTLPKADITLDDGTWLALTADRGTLNREDQRLRLEGAVNIFSDEGFELRTEHAEVDLRARTAWGDKPVEGQGPFGMLNANRFRLDRTRRTMQFEGNVHFVLYPKTGV